MAVAQARALVAQHRLRLCMSSFAFITRWQRRAVQESRGHQVEVDQVSAVRCKSQSHKATKSTLSAAILLISEKHSVCRSLERLLVRTATAYTYSYRANSNTPPRKRSKPKLLVKSCPLQLLQSSSTPYNVVPAATKLCLSPQGTPPNPFRLFYVDKINKPAN